MIIARKQINVPLTLNAEVFVMHLPLGLAPGIKYFYFTIFSTGQKPEQRRVVLDGMG
jgi:hypothetical protein